MERLLAWVFRWLQLKSIRRRFTALVLVSVLVTMVLAGLVELRTVAEDDKQELNEKANVIKQLAALAFSDPLWNYHYEGMTAIGEALFEDQEVCLLALRTTDGQIIYEHKRSAEYYYQSPSLLKEEQVLQPGATRLLGTVTVGLTTHYREKKLQQVWVDKVVGIVVVAALLWLLIGYISRLLTRPLDELRLGTEEIAAGNLDKRLLILSDDEAGELAVKFNHMADELQKMIAQGERIAKALAVSEEKFAKAFRFSSDVVGLTRLADGKYLEINETFSRVLGYNITDTIGNSSQNFGLWVNPQDYQQLYAQLRAGASSHRTECWWRRKNGEERLGHCASEVIEINGEDCVLFVWHDITEQKRAEALLQQSHDELEDKVNARTQELLAMNEELQAINLELADTLEALKNAQGYLVQSEKMAALGNLVAGVAHEINTPLGIGVTVASHLRMITERIVSLYAENSLRKNDFTEYTQECQEAVVIILENLQRAAQLIQSFKLVSVDQASEEKRVFLVKEYIDGILLSLQPKFKNTNIKIMVACDPQLAIDSYPGALAQIITNFALNSLTHAYENGQTGQIEITAQQVAKDFILRYSDDGKGISEQILPKIFDPFFTTKRGSGGSGLGLHVVYNIVASRFGGAIECKSTLGEGTCFTIRFPLA